MAVTDDFKKVQQRVRVAYARVQGGAMKPSGWVREGASSRSVSITNGQGLPLDKDRKEPRRMDASLSKLLDSLVEHAYQISERPFTLTSGEESNEYLDCKLALSQPRTMKYVADVVLSRLQRRVVAIGGLTMGSDPIAMSTSMASANGELPIRWFTVRKEPKAHGQMKLIEGSVKEGEAVAVVDDVVTSGKSVIEAIQRCRDAKLDVVQVLVLVDRQQSGGMEAVRREAGPDVEVTAIFRKEDLKERWQMPWTSWP